MRKDKNNIEIAELFMAKPASDFNRCYYGTIRRCTDQQGHPIVYGKILVENKYVVANASDQHRLGYKLDVVLTLVLDYKLEIKDYERN